MTKKRVPINESIESLKKPTGEGWNTIRNLSSAKRPWNFDLSAPIKSTTISTNQITIKQIHPNPSQPRKIFDPIELNELVASIRTYGILEPILVRSINESDQYEIIAGERRFRAALLLELKEVPVVILNISDADAVFIALTENLIREDLNPIEKGLAFSKLLELKKCSNMEEIANKLGLSRTAVSLSVGLLSHLSEEAIDFYLKNTKDISEGHLITIRKHVPKSEQVTVLQKIKDDQWSIKNTRQYVQEKYRNVTTHFMPIQIKEQAKDAFEIRVTIRPDLSVEYLDDVADQLEKQIQRIKSLSIQKKAESVTPGLNT